MLRPIVKIFGGKNYLKHFIVENFPSNYEELHYIEPCIGGGSVFLNKKRSFRESISDIDKDLISVWEATKNHLEHFTNELNGLEYTEKTFNLALDGHFSQEANYYVKQRMSRGGMGKTFAWSERLRGGIPGDVNGWKNSIKQLPQIAKRLKNVQISHCDITKLLDSDLEYESDIRVFYYIDTPYLHETRVSKDVYDHEMSFEQHSELLELIKQSKDKILISGYHSELYNKELKSWNSDEYGIVNHSGQGKKKQKRVEVVWKNY